MTSVYKSVVDEVFAKHFASLGLEEDTGVNGKGGKGVSKPNSRKDNLEQWRNWTKHKIKAGRDGAQPINKRKPQSMLAARKNAEEAEEAAAGAGAAAAAAAAGAAAAAAGAGAAAAAANSSSGEGSSSGAEAGPEVAEEVIEEISDEESGPSAASEPPPAQEAQRPAEEAQRPAEEAQRPAEGAPKPRKRRPIMLESDSDSEEGV